MFVTLHLIFTDKWVTAETGEALAVFLCNRTDYNDWEDHFIYGIDIYNEEGKHLGREFFKQFDTYANIANAINSLLS